MKSCKPCYNMLSLKMFHIFQHFVNYSKERNQQYVLMTINEDVYLDVELLEKFMEDNYLLTSGFPET